MTGVVFAAAILLAGVLTPAPSIAESSMEGYIRRGVEATARGQYDAALADFLRLVEIAPDRSEGYFFLASVYNVLTGHFEVPQYRSGFEKNSEKALAIAEGQIKANPKNAKAYMIAGLTMGMLSMDAVRRKSYVRAFFRSRKTNRFLVRAIALDPGLEDAYYALGLYYFWRVRAKWFRYIAPLIGDTGEKGLRYIRRTAEKGVWLKDLARTELVYVLYEEKRFEEARQLVKGLIAQYPEQPHYRFAYAEGYYAEKEYKQAKAEFIRVRDRLNGSGDKIDQLYAEFAEWRITRCDYELGNFDEARRRARRFQGKPDMDSPLLQAVHRAAEEMVSSLKEKAMASSSRIPPPRRYE